MARGLVLLALMIVTACAPRGTLNLVPEAAQVGQVQRIFVGTTRTPDDQGGFGSGREQQTTLVRLDISVPPSHETGGDIVWPSRLGRPDPQRDFLLTDITNFPTPAQFRSALAEDLRRNARGAREAVIYVHGFNNNFAEGVYRIAQLSYDLRIPGAAVHYSWPSRASALGYAYDRDSALFARDGLEDLLRQVTQAGADRVLFVAHSMGAYLTMESLRQIALRGDSALLAKVSGVLLMSPDIDVDVFRAQAKVIDRLPQPFVFFTARNDSTLALSAFVAREQNRLGNLRDVSRLAGLPVTLLETGEFDATDSHFAAATSPALIRLLQGAGAIDAAFRSDGDQRIGLLPGAVLTIQGATRIVLDPFANFGEQLSQ
jgi:esterase/lipase superfamily enzyme